MACVACEIPAELRADTLTQKAPTSVSWRCTRCVVVCEKSEVASVKGGHDVTCRRDDCVRNDISCGEAREESDESLNRSSTCHATSDDQVENTQEMQIAWRKYLAVNRRTSCDHAWWYWTCATLKVVHMDEVRDESAEKENPITREKANHAIK